METGDGACNADNQEHAEPDRCLNSGDVNNGVVVEVGNGVGGGKEVGELNNETVNNGVEVAGGSDVAEGEEVWGLKSEAVNNVVEVAGGCAVAEGEEVWGLKSEAVNNGVEVADGSAVAEGGEVLGLKSEDVNNGVAIADGNCVAEDKEVMRLKNETVTNRMVIAEGIGVAEADYGGVECIRTYKRRKHVKSSCVESKVQEHSRGCLEVASHLSDQALKKPYDVAVGNTSKDYSNAHWGNVVLKHLYHSLGDDNGGIQWCIREALMNNPKICCSTTDAETFKIDQYGQECSSQLECLTHRLQSEANGHANFMHIGCSSELDGQGVTKRCQRVFCNILASENFSSLCKVLLENFQGMKPESVFDFSVIDSRMKEKAYEQSPRLFLSDIQKVWGKLQDTGNEIVAIAKSLSNMSRAYCGQVGVSADSSFEDEKHVFCNRESNSHMKPEQTECATYKACTCRHCGGKVDGTDCLVCDSCEEIYHVSCIEPAVKEIPHKSWFCANCTASGIGSPHENCVVCERLSIPKTLNNNVGVESIPTNEETLHELEENSNCTYDGIQVSIGGRNSPDCKICGKGVDGEKIKICGHPFCPSKYYHVRCLSNKQIKSYGPHWYCPSCLCRVCLTDQDDDKIVLCDGCDHAYHLYCMKPPRTSIPRGKWFCRKCDAGIQAIRRAKKAYESNKWRTGENVSKPDDMIDKKWNNKLGRELDKVGGMDMLLTAANTLNLEENLAAIQIESQRT